MSAAAADPHRLRHNEGDRNEATGHGEGGPSSKRIMTGYGFWIFLLSDIIMFSAFFAAYAVLAGATAGGPHPTDIFKLDTAAVETACLLASSLACGMASVATDARSQLWAQVSFLVTGILGFVFLLLESASLPASSRRATGRNGAPSCRASSRWSAATACTLRVACSGSAR